MSGRNRAALAALAAIGCGGASPAWWQPGGAGCPQGTQIVGAGPPSGDHVECKRADGIRHGPALWWRHGGKPAMQVTYRDNRQDGLLINWYDNGHKQSEFRLVRGVMSGPARTWYENGQLAIETTCVHNRFHGNVTIYYPSGHKAEQGQYAADKRVGVWTRWREDGRKQRQRTFDQTGKLIRTVTWGHRPDLHRRR